MYRPPSSRRELIAVRWAGSGTGHWALETTHREIGQRWPETHTVMVTAAKDPRLVRSALASSFVAALELAKQGKVEIAQAEPFAPLMLRQGRSLGRT